MWKRSSEAFEGGGGGAQRRMPGAAESGCDHVDDHHECMACVCFCCCSAGAVEKMRGSILLLLVAYTSGQPCTQRMTCSTCAEAPDDSSAACFWCYDSVGGGCKEIGDISQGGLLGGCENLTFSALDCACQPAERRSCGECTPDWNCVWANASLSVAYTTPLMPVTVLTVGTGAACRVGTGFGGPETLGSEVAWEGPAGGEYVISWVLKPATWYWSQCAVAGRAPAFMYTFCGLALLGCCCGACALCHRRRRRRRHGTAADVYYREYRSVPPQQTVVPVVPVGYGQPIPAGQPVPQGIPVVRAA